MLLRSYIILGVFIHIHIKIQGGVCVDVVDDEGYAPLHLAVEAVDGPDFKMTTLLLQVNPIWLQVVVNKKKC